MNYSRLPVALFLCVFMGSVDADESALIVVEDAGGNSALPYYRSLHLPEKKAHRTSEPLADPISPDAPYREAQMLPVRSERLRPGRIVPKPIRTPGQQPMFLIGNDNLSRTWLKDQLPTLRRLRAVGIVVEVDSISALNELRRLAPSLVLIPASGDELAQRLGLQHYPILITSTGTEQ